MAIPAASLSAAAAYAQAAKAKIAVAEGGAPGFEAVLSDTLGKAAAAGQNAETMAIKGLAKKADLVDVVPAVSQAELTMETVVAVRDRMISAYQDIMRMPI